MKKNFIPMAILVALLMGATTATVTANENGDTPEDFTLTPSRIEASITKTDEAREVRAEEKEEREEKQRERLEVRDEAKKERAGAQNAKKEERDEKRDENGEKREEMKKEREEKKDERMEEREEKMQERKSKLDEKRKARISERADRIIKRMSAAVDRIERLTDRVASRIDKFTERGLDTTSSLALLVTAEAKTAEARALIIETELAIATALEGDDPKEAFKEVRTIVKSVIANIRAAHASLVEVIKDLKGKVVVRNEEEEEDTTPETEA